MTAVNTSHLSIIEGAFKDLDRIRDQHPVVHNLTNYVAMQTNANVLLALGASPIMAHALAELTDIVNIAKSLVINIGTLDENWIEAIECAQSTALTLSVPIIFDPVGAGASTYRTQVAKNILHKGVQILRGNPAEIIALANAPIQSSGVDSAYQSQAAIHAAHELAERYHCVVIVSGEVDIIVHQQQVVYNNYGTSLFRHVTAMGCSVTAAIGAFSAVNKNYFQAAQHAMLIYTVAGQFAAQSSKGPATFLQQFIDDLFVLQKDTINKIIMNNQLTSESCPR